MTTPTRPFIRYATDGHTRPATKDDMQVGIVVRSTHKSESTVPAYSDSTVSKVEQTEHGMLLTLLRPVMFVTPKGTPKVYVETFQVYESSFIGRFHVVLLSTGLPQKMDNASEGDKTLVGLERLS